MIIYIHTVLHLRTTKTNSEPEKEKEKRERKSYLLLTSHYSRRWQTSAGIIHKKTKCIMYIIKATTTTTTA